MAYNTRGLRLSKGGPLQEWVYDTSDLLSTVLGAGYISDAVTITKSTQGRGMRPGDPVLVRRFTSVTVSGNVLTIDDNTYVGSTDCVVMSVNTTTGVAQLAEKSATQSVQLYSNFRNLIDGGDFTINPWQRGTTFTNITGIVYTADRFFVFGSDIVNSGVSAKAARVAFSSIAGLGQAFRFGRASTASSLSAIWAGQILETNDSIRLQGQPVTLSFWAASEANFSAASGLMASLVQGTGTDQSAASALAGTWTAQTNVFSSLQALTSTMTRYSFSGVVSGNTTQVGMLLNYTPVGSAGAADSVLIEGVQLEVGPIASTFEHRDVEVELALCQRYCFVLSEPASGIAVAMAVSTASNKLAATVPLPTPMRAAPSIVVLNGSFGVQLAGAYLAVTGIAAGVGHTGIAVNLVASAVVASNNAATLVGGGGTGSVVASAEY